jgi:hypothetical protein
MSAALSRRGMLAGIAASAAIVPASAKGAPMPADDVMVFTRLRAELDAALAAREPLMNAFDAAEVAALDAEAAFNTANPKPKLPSEPFLADKTAFGQITFAGLIEMNREAAQRESAWDRDMLEPWRKRRDDHLRPLQQQLHEAEAAYDKATDVVDAVIDRAKAMPARTLESLRCKARLLACSDNPNEASAILDDLLGDSG